jgi:hypothetical protein
LAGVIGVLALRAAAQLWAADLTGTVLDEASGQPLAARLYLQDTAGKWFFAESGSPDGSAVRYAKTNWVNPRAVEVHTTLSAHPFRVNLPAGGYTLTVERGKEYRPLTQRVEIGTEPRQVRLPLRRWINLAERGWYSGETHLHRTTDELRNIVLAEDLNVAFPLSSWITKAFVAPTTSERNLPDQALAELVRVDDTHVIWPRNTEYEIFSVGDRQHTLGALFLLNHRRLLTQGAPPWGPLAAQAKGEGALLDMDKLDWAFSVVLPPATGAQLYELANNHMWRTAFAFTNYVSWAPAYLAPLYGSHGGNERDWTLYTFGMYYTLLNAGFRCVPAAGTANGVHPVPAGFSRVYVHLPGGFSYEQWLRGLAAGRSYVTTGPMLFAQVNGADPGKTFRPGAEVGKYRVSGSVVSEEALAFVEIIHNGMPARMIRPQDRETPGGARASAFDAELSLKGSGWLAVRCWEERGGGRFRWAHTAPWHIEVPEQPLRLRVEEKEFLVDRMKSEIARSRGVLPREALDEYDRALGDYERMATRDDAAAIAQPARSPANERDLRRWLENMIWHHGFTATEVRAATGLTLEAISAAQRRYNIHATNRPPHPSAAPMLVLPYPGGRHPRLGFLEGALNPQRDTKLSVFTPWDDRSYVVVDAPEAIWSNLGLTYLAHEHVATIWDQQGLKLAPVEWDQRPDGSCEFERTLPNGIAFGTKAMPGRGGLRLHTWLRNGTANTLTKLRLQNCVMLKAARGFAAQTGQNKVLRPPYAACRSEDGNRWIITAWDPLNNVWHNPPVPCIHSDPKFADCAPGQTVHVRGWLSFYEGQDLPAELDRLERAGWRE